MFRFATGTILISGTAGVLLAASPPPAPRPAHAPVCFNMRGASEFRIVGPGKIRVTSAGQDRFDVELTGPGCAIGKSALAIASAPVADLCLGRQPYERILRLKREGQPTVQCTVGLVTRAPDPPPDEAPRKKRR